jgi:hypothetical protein
LAQWIDAPVELAATSALNFFFASRSINDARKLAGRDGRG